MAITISDELIALAAANLARPKFPEVRQESVLRRLAEYRCSPKYPEVVAHNMMLARELCVAGCICSELFTVALHYTAVAAESALNWLFLERLDRPFTMRRRIYESVRRDGRVEKKLVRVEEKVFTERPLLYEFAHAGWRLVGPLAEKCRNFDSLIRWAEQMSLISEREANIFEAGRKTRNLTAHGHDMVGMWSWGLAALRHTTLIFNRLFPDPEITAYDEENRRREEERMREYDLSVDEMLQLPSDEPEEDS
jgi:hypothetical protein